MFIQREDGWNLVDFKFEYAHTVITDYTSSLSVGYSVLN